MKNQIDKVKAFHLAFNQPAEVTPKLVRDRIILRQSLIEEEIRELDAAGKDLDLIEVADAIVDSLYILLGTAIEFGLSDILEELFDEVHASNMSKLDEEGKPIYREDGKILKSTNYRSPDLSKIILDKINGRK